MPRSPVGSCGLSAPRYVEKDVDLAAGLTDALGSHPPRPKRKNHVAYSENPLHGGFRNQTSGQDRSTG